MVKYESNRKEVRVLMAAKDLNELEQEIKKLTKDLDYLVNNNPSNLRSDTTLQLSQQLDNLIVNYMKSTWQVLQI